MDSSTAEQLQHLLQVRQRHEQLLRALQLQRAGFGELHVPPHVTGEISRVEGELMTVNAQIGRLVGVLPQAGSDEPFSAYGRMVPGDTPLSTLSRQVEGVRDELRKQIQAQSAMIFGDVEGVRDEVSGLRRWLVRLAVATALAVLLILFAMSLFVIVDYYRNLLSAQAALSEIVRAVARG